MHSVRQVKGKGSCDLSVVLPLIEKSVGQTFRTITYQRRVCLLARLLGGQKKAGEIFA